VSEWLIEPVSKTGVRHWRTAGSNPALSGNAANLALAGFEPPKGVGKGFSHVVGVVGASAASDTRGAEPLWKSAFADLGSNPALSVTSDKHDISS
jgi:hypothetical protein